MNIHEAFAPGVDPKTFFLEHLPAMLEARRDLLAQAYETAVIICVHLTDTGARYTFEIGPKGCRVEAGEMIDFPVATIAGPSTQWEHVKRWVRRIADPLERRGQRRRPQSRLTREFLDAFHRFDGEFQVELSADDLDTPIRASVILNDYQLPDGAPQLTVSADLQTGEALARGDIGPADLEERVQLGGDLSFGFDIGGLLLKHFPELER